MYRSFLEGRHSLSQSSETQKLGCRSLERGSSIRCLTQWLRLMGTESLACPEVGQDPDPSLPHRAVPLSAHHGGSHVRVTSRPSNSLATEPTGKSLGPHRPISQMLMGLTGAQVAPECGDRETKA